MPLKSVSVQLKNRLMSSSSNSGSPSTISCVISKQPSFFSSLSFLLLLSLSTFVFSSFVSGYPQNEPRRNERTRRTCTCTGLSGPLANTHRSAPTSKNRLLESHSMKSTMRTLIMDQISFLVPLCPSLSLFIPLYPSLIVSLPPLVSPPILFRVLIRLL